MNNNIGKTVNKTSWRIIKQIHEATIKEKQRRAKEGKIIIRWKRMKLRIT